MTFDAKWGANTRALQKYEVIDNPGMYYEMHYRAMNNYYKSTGMNDQAAWLGGKQESVWLQRWIGIQCIYSSRWAIPHRSER